MLPLHHRVMVSGRACRPPCSHLSIHGSRECAGRITRYISEERPRKTVSGGVTEPAGQEKRRGCDWALPGARAPGRVPDALRSPPSNRRHRPAPWGRTNLRVLRGSPPGRPGGRTQVGKDSSIHLDCQRCEMGRFQVMNVGNARGWRKKNPPGPTTEWAKTSGWASRTIIR